ncbi:conserved Plasmodium protein, unknown function [Plasmodium relictum]|uniref:Secreted ookinete protein n=1 Tax=Plasmodium relictum TaxID=85471 RepID=A0A1J1H7K2_PLARL|nr:conserved Plasmodium protein, unknown function [Plasmodium relictum]CRH00936.1 conserved Plasmodium protein, unknown function [Plasmodium relictum]
MRKMHYLSLLFLSYFFLNLVLSENSDHQQTENYLNTNNVHNQSKPINVSKTPIFKRSTSEDGHVSVPNKKTTNDEERKQTSFIIDQELIDELDRYTNIKDEVILRPSIESKREQMGGIIKRQINNVKVDETEEKYKKCSKYSTTFCETPKVYSSTVPNQDDMSYHYYDKFLQMSNKLSKEYHFYDSFIEHFFSIYNSYVNIEDNNYHSVSVSVNFHFRRHGEDMNFSDLNVNAFGYINKGNTDGGARLGIHIKTELDLKKIISNNRTRTASPNSLPGSQGYIESVDDELNQEDEHNRTYLPPDLAIPNKACEAISESNINLKENFFTLNEINNKLSVSKLQDFMDKCFKKGTNETETKSKSNEKTKQTKSIDDLMKDLKDSLVTKNMAKCKLSFNAIKNYSSGFSNVISLFTLMVIIIYMCL